MGLGLPRTLISFHIGVYEAENRFFKSFWFSFSSRRLERNWAIPLSFPVEYISREVLLLINLPGGVTSHVLN